MKKINDLRNVCGGGGEPVAPVPEKPFVKNLRTFCTNLNNGVTTLFKNSYNGFIGVVNETVISSSVASMDDWNFGIANKWTALNFDFGSTAGVFGLHFDGGDRSKYKYFQ